MPYINDDYFISLLEEQRRNQLAIDEQIQVELLGLTESIVAKQLRRRYMEHLAIRILQIDSFLEQWLNGIHLPSDRPVE
ncbi:hypothetical protein [Mucilaginibacter sp. PAMB04168]|uniref:hypothetical protein n=1 Tax=Mucilaginibacter sp. PAMB04168 TaxID=3138567 RepID=UPI0031F645A6